ncbi:hypothetical protein CCHL11_02291 [Colletotrichum chlorophyti]|uniref:Geranylgeranyl pyrophosphate synthetase n=1 Tax=Colletotrichum chlorophyti TaxID=708187 RepID=A0A1Q8S5Q8_9PEZI|nr:hypothetical protein CCHL11_02291 [Colletotrichum chlorophyti]
MYRTFQKNQPRPAAPAPPLGSVIETVSIADLTEPASAFAPSARVTDCRFVASYNWLDKPKPSILVPGAPAQWTPRSEPRKLSEDNGIYYRDKNAARYPDHPMEAAARAIMTMHPAPATKQVDIVACGSTLGNLLRFVRGEDRPFRILVEIVGNAVHLIRRENSPTETIPDVRGYGHAFPKANTTWDKCVRRSVSHQRLLQYDFGNLNFIIRHEGDGYLEDKFGWSLNGTKIQADIEKRTIEELIDGLRTHEAKLETGSQQSEMQMQSGGYQVPQKAIFDLKTRSIKRKDEDFLGEELPRLWVAQTPNFILAYHERGTFTDINNMDVSEKVNDWEKSMNKELSLLAALLHRLVGIARSQRGTRLEISRQDLETLDVRAQCTGLAPPFEVETMSRWEDWLTSHALSAGGEKDGIHKTDRDEV